MSSAVRTEKERYMLKNYPRVIEANKGLNEDVMILTNENRELKADKEELQDQVNALRRGEGVGRERELGIGPRFKLCNNDIWRNHDGCRNGFPFGYFYNRFHSLGVLCRMFLIDSCFRIMVSKSAGGQNMTWSFRELLSRSLFTFPPLYSRRREASLDNRGTGVIRDFSPRSRSSTSPLNTSKERAIDRNPESAGSAQIPAHLSDRDGGRVLGNESRNKRTPAPNTEALTGSPSSSPLDGPEPVRASVNPLIIQHTDGSQTWLCPCHEEPVSWEGNCPSCSVEAV